MGNCQSGSSEKDTAPAPAPAARVSNSKPTSTSSGAKKKPSSKKKRSSDGLVDGSDTGKHFSEVYKLGSKVCRCYDIKYWVVVPERRRTE